MLVQKHNESLRILPHLSGFDHQRDAGIKRFLHRPPLARRAKSIKLENIGVINVIRMAKKSDGPAVLPIVNQIFEEMELKTMAKIPQDILFKELAIAYQTENYRYSYRRTLVATDDDDQVVGVAVGYPESDEAHVDDALQALWPKVGLPADYRLFTDKEARPGEWYLDSLAVAPAAQHHGNRDVAAAGSAGACAADNRAAPDFAECGSDQSGSRAAVYEERVSQYWRPDDWGPSVSPYGAGYLS
jgi:hypothetical protein